MCLVQLSYCVAGGENDAGVAGLLHRDARRHVGFRLMRREGRRQHSKKVEVQKKTAAGPSHAEARAEEVVAAVPSNVDALKEEVDVEVARLGAEAIKEDPSEPASATHVPVLEGQKAPGAATGSQVPVPEEPKTEAQVSEFNVSAIALSPPQRKVLCYLKEQVQTKLTADFDQDSAKPSLASCAVVSNAAALLHFKLGNEIDGHEAVFRINQSPTEGYEEFVGSKCTYRLGWRLSDNNTCPTLNKVDNIIATADGLQGGNAIVEALYPDIRKFNGLQGGVTSGFFVMLTALSICDEVDSYQMTPSKDAGESWAYYQEQKPDGTAMSLFASHPDIPANSYHGYTHEEWGLWKFLSTTGAEAVSLTGVTKTPGLSTIDCEGVDTTPPFNIPALPQ